MSSFDEPTADKSSEELSTGNDDASPTEKYLDFDEPVTSPARPYESPVPSPSEPPSSARSDDSSPLEPSPYSSPAQSSSSSGTTCPVTKKKRYEFSKLDVPYKPLYWPPAVPSDGLASCEGSNPNSGALQEQSFNDINSASGDVACSEQWVQEQSFNHIASDEAVVCGELSVHEQSASNDCLEASDADLTVLSAVDVQPIDLNESSDQCIHATGGNVDDSSDSSAIGSLGVSSSSSSVPSSQEDSAELLRDSDSNSNCSDDAGNSSSSDSEKSDADFSFGALKLYDGCDLTVDEGVSLLMDLFLTHKLKKTTLECFLKVILKFMPDSNNMPRSKHALFQYVENVCPSVKVKVHYYCQTCHFYVGEKDEKCSMCKSSCNKFYQLPLASQITNLFENLNLSEIVEKYAEERRTRQTHDKYFDICDGTVYKGVQLPGNYTLTLLGHTDGISISNSSNVSLWPLEFVITELPPKLRYQFVLVAGVWVDRSKPNMHCYLKPFADEFKELASSGITWINPKTKKKEKSFVFSPFFCGDAPVRAELQHIVTHCGKQSGNCCEQKMVKLPPEPVLLGVQQKKRKRVFFPQENPSPLRTAERMEAQGKACRANYLETGKLVPVKGVKGGSMISRFPSCDRSVAVYPEYMHSILGITKQFMHLWFETDLECNLKAYRNEIDVILGGVRVPDYVTRCPKTTIKFSEWKANECRSFVLYLSVIVLGKFMSCKYLQHWMMFVSAVYLLLQDVVSENDIERADIMLKMFLRDFPKLYTPESLTYNLHNLSHYGLTTRRMGPLWSNSAFHYEDFNGLLSKRIHGTKNQGIEFVKTIQLIQGVKFLKARIQNKSSNAERSTFFRNEVPSLKLTGLPKNLLAASNLEPRMMFYRAIISGQTFTCNIYKRQIQKNNFTVCYKNSCGVKQYGEINFFVECTNDRKMAFINCFTIEHGKMFYHESGVFLKHIIPIQENNEVLLIPLQNILFKVIRVDSFLCIRPNKYEVNL